MMQYCYRGQAEQKSRESVPHKLCKYLYFQYYNIRNVSEYQKGKGLCSRKIVIASISTELGNNVHSESSPCVLTPLRPGFAALDGEF